MHCERICVGGGRERRKRSLFSWIKETIPTPFMYNWFELVWFGFKCTPSSPMIAWRCWVWSRNFRSHSSIWIHPVVDNLYGHDGRLCKQPRWIPSQLIKFFAGDKRIINQAVIYEHDSNTNGITRVSATASSRIRRLSRKLSHTTLTFNVSKLLDQSVT